MVYPTTFEEFDLPTIDLAINALLKTIPRDPSGRFYITSRGRIPTATLGTWLRSEQGKQWFSSYYALLDDTSADRINAGYLPDSVPVAPYRSAADVELENWMEQLGSSTQRQLLYQYGVTDLFALDDAQKVQLSDIAKRMVQANAAVAAANEANRNYPKIEAHKLGLEEARAKQNAQWSAAQVKQQQELERDISAARDTARAGQALQARLDAAKKLEGVQMAAVSPEAYSRWAAGQPVLSQEQGREATPVLRVYTTRPGETKPSSGVTADYREWEATGKNLPMVSWSPDGTRTELVVEEANQAPAPGPAGPDMSRFAAWFKGQPEYAQYKGIIEQRYATSPSLAKQYDVEVRTGETTGNFPPGFQEWVDLSPARKAQYESDRAAAGQRVQAAAYSRALVSPRTKFLRY